MQDLAGKITELLGDPEIMKQIKELSGFAGHDESNGEEQDCSNQTCESEETAENFEFPSEILQMVLKLGPLLSSFKKEDKYTKFLKALKPLLSKPRQQKLESSSQILQIIRILPLLKNIGFFN